MEQEPPLSDIELKEEKFSQKKKQGGFSVPCEALHIIQLSRK